MKKETYEKKIGDILKLEQFEKLVYPRKNSKDWTRTEQDCEALAMKHQLSY